MAKNIDFMGAIFPDVPSVKLPQQGGGLVAFDDTTDATATADKILQGYTAYAGGEKLVGTASGGITPTGTISITQNGQVDVTNYATADVNVSGGGASNLVVGSFTTASTRNSTGTFAIPYTGNGYPIALMVFVKGGVYNATTSGNSQWYQSTNRYDVGQYCMVKSATPIEPTYGGSYSQGAVSIIYKNSTTISTTYRGTWSVNDKTYGNETDSAQASTLCVRFKGNGTTVSYFIGNLSSSTIGLAPNTEYEYIAVYSE